MRLSIVYLFHKFLNFVLVNKLTGGLEISDSTLHFSYFDGKRWQMVGLRLPAGIIVGGKVADYEKFIQVLTRLRTEILKGRNRRYKIPVVVSIDSSNVYTQVFSLPVLRDTNLEEAIKLNIQMASPMDVAQTYNNYQIVGEDKNLAKLDILSAFVNKDIVDTINRGLAEAGFLVMAVESRAMSLTRLIRNQAIGAGVNHPYVVLNLDNENLDFLIVRNGQLYFEYINSWRDLRGDNKEISLTDFKALITRNLRQVLNFYSQHWSDSIEEVLLVAVGLQDEISRIISDGFSLKVKNLELRFDQPIAIEWLSALGSGIRAVSSRRNDLDISLLGVSAKDEFREEMVLSFFGFWRIAIPVAFGLLLVIFLGSSVFLNGIDKSLNEQSSVLAGDERMKEIENFKLEADKFNKSVALISSIRVASAPKSFALNKISEKIEQNNISMTAFSFREYGVPSTLSGEAKSQEDILNFKTGLEADPQFRDVKLSLTDIRSSNQGFIFSITFSIISLKTN